MEIKYRFLTALVVLFILGIYITQTSNDKESLVMLTVGGAPLKVEVAYNHDTRAKGLMYRNFLPSDTGMIFTFDNHQPLTFWNKNTYIDLDLIWVRDDKVIGFSLLPQYNGMVISVDSPEPADSVIEVNAGWVRMNNISLGDDVLFK
jgi:uncharacterized protein